MDDFETHPVGTADLVERLREKQICTGFEQVEPGVIDCVYGSDPVCQDAADRIEQLEAALTRANAATAAAYEVAACEAELWDGNILAYKIRALATPDQTAALDKLIAEAEARGKEKAAGMLAGMSRIITHTDEDLGTLTGRNLIDPRKAAAAIPAASKKGGV